MAEPADQLRHALDDLNRALEANSSIDMAVRERLGRAVDEIHAALARLPADSGGVPSAQAADTTSAEPPDSLTGQLAGVAREFEVSHPTLSGMVGSVIDALARMGI